MVKLKLQKMTFIKKLIFGNDVPVTSIQICHFNTNLSLQHKFVTPTRIRHFNTNLSLRYKCVISTQMRYFDTNASLQHKTENKWLLWGSDMLKD